VQSIGKTSGAKIIQARYFNFCPQFSQKASSGDVCELQLRHRLAAPAGGRDGVELLPCRAAALARSLATSALAFARTHVCVRMRFAPSGPTPSLPASLTR